MTILLVQAKRCAIMAEADSGDPLSRPRITFEQEQARQQVLVATTRALCNEFCSDVNLRLPPSVSQATRAQTMWTVETYIQNQIVLLKKGTWVDSAIQ